MSIDDFTESEARYRCLWLAVVLRAKQDAEGRNLMVEGNPSEAPKLVREAREWLSTPSEELGWVAWAAGVEERNLINVGSEIIRRSEEERQELGQGDLYGSSQRKIGARGSTVKPETGGTPIRLREEIVEGDNELRDQQFSSQLGGEGTDLGQLAGHDDTRTGRLQNGEATGGPEERHGEVEVRPVPGSSVE